MGKAIHAFVYANVGLVVGGDDLEFVVRNDGLGKEGDREEHVLWSGEGRLQMEITDICSDELGFQSGKDGIDE